MIKRLRIVIMMGLGVAGAHLEGCGDKKVVSSVPDKAAVGVEYSSGSEAILGETLDYSRVVVDDRRGDKAEYQVFFNKSTLGPVLLSTNADKVQVVVGPKQITLDLNRGRWMLNADGKGGFVLKRLEPKPLGAGPLVNPNPQPSTPPPPSK